MQKEILKVQFEEESTQVEEYLLSYRQTATSTRAPISTMGPSSPPSDAAVSLEIC